MKKKHLIWLIIIWASIIIASLAWNYSLIISNNKKVVLNKSQAFFEQIITTRAWNSQHGGLYVPITAETQPNPYLIDTLRDIVTVDSMRLTKINPAYMTRQIAEIHKTDNNLRFHITGLNPIRPANKADKWETKALNLFEGNTSEILELVRNDSSSQYRYMAPLITEKSCLKCHSRQGYKLGGIRGGISVSFPSALYTKVINEQLFSFALIHFLILSLGIIGLMVYYRISNNYFSIIKTKNEKLLQINATKDKLFSIIAHDLKGPFNIILGYSDLLKTGYDGYEEDKRKKLINEIDKSSKKAFELLENLLLWARTHRNKIKIVKENLNLKKNIIEAIGVYLPYAEKKNITIDISVSENLNIYADKFSIKTIISNLFNNAVKFTPQNGNIKINAIRKDNFIEISISDTGVGIPPEIIPKLFRIEDSISTKDTDNEKGTGLGLLLCKEFTEKHKGKIRVESELGKGTKIIFTIPENEEFI